MPELTRRRDPDAQQETWLIHYGDVRVGVIAERIGNPDSTPGWQWSCGFYPGSQLAERASGLADSFDQARRAFGAAWRVCLANRTEADFEEYRRDRAFHAWKQAMWAAGLKLPTQAADGRAVCFCGAAIGLKDMDVHVYAAHMEPETA
jgi:hypothetical protein